MPPPGEPHGEIVVTLPSKGQLVIRATLRRMLGIGPGSRLSLKLEGKGLRMAMDPAAFARSI